MAVVLVEVSQAGKPSRFIRMVVREKTPEIEEPFVDHLREIWDSTIAA